MKYRIICSVTSKSLMTPSRSGRMATMLAGVRPTIRFASAPMASTRFVRVSMATTLRLADDDAAVADRDERVGRAEVDPDVVAEEAEQAVEESQGPSRVCSGRRPVARQGGRVFDEPMRCVGAPRTRRYPTTAPRGAPAGRSSTAAVSDLYFSFDKRI